MKHNTMKRVLAGTLAVLTVAAYAPANVGGFLTGSTGIVANAEQAPSYVQLGGLIRTDKSAEPYIEGLYKVTQNAGKFNYEKITTATPSSDVSVTLQKDSVYVLRTTAYIQAGDETAFEGPFTTNGNNEALAEGVYEYRIKTVQEDAVATASAIMTNVSFASAVDETYVVTQNKEEVIYNGAASAYPVVAGYPAVVTVTPNGSHTAMALTTSSTDVVVKSQTKENGVITMNFVVTSDVDGINIPFNWGDYVPTLALAYDEESGKVTATDTGFNHLVTDAWVGTYEFRYGKAVGSNNFIHSNMSGTAYIQADDYNPDVVFTPRATTTNQVTTTYLSEIADTDTKYYKQNPDGTFQTTSTDADKVKVDDGRTTTTYKAVTKVNAISGSAVLTDADGFAIETVFTLVNQGTAYSDGTFTYGAVLTKDKDTSLTASLGADKVYHVAWQNNQEIDFVVKSELTTLVEGTNYYITGTQTATDPGTYEIYINPVDNTFNNGEVITVKWAIDNTNCFVERKSAHTEDVDFSLNYRQASKDAIKTEISKKLNFVGSKDLTVVSYTEMPTLAWKYVDYDTDALETLNYQDVSSEIYDIVGGLFAAEHGPEVFACYDAINEFYCVPQQQQDKTAERKAVYDATVEAWTVATKIVDANPTNVKVQALFSLADIDDDFWDDFKNANESSFLSGAKGVADCVTQIVYFAANPTATTIDQDVTYKAFTVAWQSNVYVQTQAKDISAIDDQIHALYNYDSEELIVQYAMEIANIARTYAHAYDAAKNSGVSDDQAKQQAKDVANLEARQYVQRMTNMQKPVEDPDAAANTDGMCYVAYVANAVANDGVSSAMTRDGKKVALEKVAFIVNPTAVAIIPTVTEITYGDDIKLSELYQVIDKNTKEVIGVPWQAEPTLTLTGGTGDKIGVSGTSSTKELDAAEYTYNVTAELLDKKNYTLDNTATSDVTFTVNPRDLSDMNFDTVKVEPDENATNKKSVRIKTNDIANAANKLENPAKFKGVDTDSHQDATENLVSTPDLLIAGGYTSAKLTEVGKVLTVNVRGSHNFTGTAQVQWSVSGQSADTTFTTCEAEFDAEKPRVMAKVDLTKLEGDIKTVKLYFSNNGKMNDMDVAAQATADVLKQADYGKDAAKNPKNSKVQVWDEATVKKALAGDGLLTVEIANSSVLKQVYVMAAVEFKNGETVFDTIQAMNYYDMVMQAEGALEFTKTDIVGTGTGAGGNGLTKDKTYVKLDVTRADKKGYTAKQYGVAYNNNDYFKQAEDKIDIERKNADSWLTLDHRSETKTVKIAELSEDEVSTKRGVYAYILNTAGENGVGQKKVYAKVF